MVLHDNVKDPIQDTLLDAMIPCPYLHVSRLWRDRIIEASGGALSFIIFTDREDYTYHQLNELSQYATSLRVTRCSTGQWLRDVLSNTDLRSLRELRIDGMVVNDQ